VVLLPESNRVVVASGEDGMLRVFDESMKVIASLEGLADADNVRYDPQEQRIYVGYAQGALAVIDPEKVAKLADIKLEGHPESFQLEPRGRRIFVNVPSAKQVAVIDRDKAAVVAKWPVTEAYANYPMALDEAHERLLIVCRKPPRLLVLDTKSGRVVAQLECCGDADDIFYDADRRRIYISGGEGCISVFEQQDADRYSPLAKIATVTGARTSLLSPQTGRLYLAVPHGSGREAEVRVYRIQP
jgi:DNA-binding beta-propeller fold protein YncE